MNSVACQKKTEYGAEDYDGLFIRRSGRLGVISKCGPTQHIRHHSAVDQTDIPSNPPHPPTPAQWRAKQRSSALASGRTALRVCKKMRKKILFRV